MLVGFWGEEVEKKEKKLSEAKEKGVKLGQQGEPHIPLMAHKLTLSMVY